MPGGGRGEKRPTGPGLSCEKKVVWDGEWGEVVSWGRECEGRMMPEVLAPVASSLLTFSPHSRVSLKPPVKAGAVRGGHMRAQSCLTLRDPMD